MTINNTKNSYEIINFLEFFSLEIIITKNIFFKYGFFSIVSNIKIRL